MDKEKDVHKYIAYRMKICYIYIRLIEEGYCKDERFMNMGIKNNMRGILQYCKFLSDEIERVKNAANRAIEEVKKDE